MAKGRAAIIDECSKQDSSATGTLPLSDLAQCITAAVASFDLPAAQSLLADIISPATEPVDYRMFARRFRVIIANNNGSVQDGNISIRTGTT